MCIRDRKAADAAMAVAAELIRELRPGLTSEEIRHAMTEACDEHGCDLPDDVIVSHGAQAAVGHEEGHGEIGAGKPVVVDIWPRDKASRCWADMTRTFVAGGGEPPEELARYWELTRASLGRVYPMVRAGADCQALYEASCEPYHEAGLPTQLNKEPGTVLEDGYFHGLGHGIGLELHERPHLGRSPDTLRAGDVVTLEPCLLYTSDAADDSLRVDLGGVDDVVGGDAVRGDHEQVAVELIELPHLAAEEEGGHPPEAIQGAGSLIEDRTESPSRSRSRRR